MLFPCVVLLWFARCFVCLTSKSVVLFVCFVCLALFSVALVVWRCLTLFCLFHIICRCFVGFLCLFKPSATASVVLCCSFVSFVCLALCSLVLIPTACIVLFVTTHIHCMRSTFRYNTRSLTSPSQQRRDKSAERDKRTPQSGGTRIRLPPPEVEPFNAQAASEVEPFDRRGLLKLSQNYSAIALK